MSSLSGTPEILSTRHTWSLNNNIAFFSEAPATVQLCTPCLGVYLGIGIGIGIDIGINSGISGPSCVCCLVYLQYSLYLLRPDQAAVCTIV